MPKHTAHLESHSIRTAPPPRSGRVAAAARRSASDLAVQTAGSFAEASTSVLVALRDLTACAAGTVFSAADSAGSALVRRAPAVESAAAALLGTAEVGAFSTLVATCGLRIFAAASHHSAHTMADMTGVELGASHDQVLFDAAAFTTLAAVVVLRLVVFGGRDVVRIGRDHAQWAADEPDIAARNQPVLKALIA